MTGERSAGGDLKDRGDDDAPRPARQLVSCLLEGEQLGALDLVRERDSVLVGEDGVVRAVDHEGGEV